MEDVEPPGSSMVSVADHIDNSVPLILRNTLSKMVKKSPLASQSVHHFPRFKSNQKTQAFRKKFFPGVCNAEWNDWHWQLRNRIRDIDTLAGIISLSEDEYSAIAHHRGTLP
jgi:lysine 2,3-aminomutase